MKKSIMAALLTLVMVLACTGCSSLFSNESVVSFGDTYTHNDPKDLTYDERIVLKGDGFASRIEEAANGDAYPDIMIDGKLRTKQRKI